MSISSPNAAIAQADPFGDPHLPRISGANTMVRPNSIQKPLATQAADDNFAAAGLQATMLKQTPLPYQTQEFRPSVALKKFEPTARVSDTFALTALSGDEALSELRKKRTMILHTDRYVIPGRQKSDSHSQQQRLQQEGQLVEDARSRMRLREALAHRARHDLHLGGDQLLSDNDSQRSKQQPLAARRRPKRPRLPAAAGAEASEAASLLQDDSELHRWRSDWPRRGGGGGQLLSHSSARSLPALPVSQRSAATFATRSELDAIAAMLEAPATDAGEGGLDRVKLDGCKAKFNRRSDIMAEINRLKAIVLPDFAKDLYIGRGIHLPNQHAINNPRKKMTAKDAVLEALAEVSEQPQNSTDAGGNILLAGGAEKQIFVADVMKESENEQQQQQQQQPEPQPPHEDPFQEIVAEEGDSSVNDETLQQQLSQLELPAAAAAYVQQLRSRSQHQQAAGLALRTGAAVQRLLAASQQLIGCLNSQPELLGDWLDRGLRLYRDIDRERKSSVSLAGYWEIVAAMCGAPLADAEMRRLAEALGLPEETLTKLEYLATVPFLPGLLRRDEVEDKQTNERNSVEQTN